VAAERDSSDCNNHHNYYLHAPANNPPNMRILSAGRRRREKEHCSRVVNEKILSSTANELLVKNERK
jgi:hypothetical protein